MKKIAAINSPSRFPSVSFLVRLHQKHEATLSHSQLSPAQDLETAQCRHRNQLPNVQHRIWNRGDISHDCPADRVAAG